ncbi:MAG: SRPBCC domain-containing protein [Myxococcales bacterium]|nr:SRPBCC domain-containing protein [Myxococcales bacterium]
MRDIQLSEHLPHPRELVWRCLTEPELLERWLAPSDFRAEVGAQFTLRMPAWPGWDGQIRGEVLECHPPERLVYSWQGSAMAAPTTVSWQLTAVDGGTLLQLDHTGFRGLFLRLVHALGWRPQIRSKLARLLVSLDPGEGA